MPQYIELVSFTLSNVKCPSHVVQTHASQSHASQTN